MTEVERPPRERNRATPPSLLRAPIDDYVREADEPGVVRYACTACGCRSPTPTHASCGSVLVSPFTKESAP